MYTHTDTVGVGVFSRHMKYKAYFKEKSRKHGLCIENGGKGSVSSPSEKFETKLSETQSAAISHTDSHY